MFAGVMRSDYLFASTNVVLIMSVVMGFVSISFMLGVILVGPRLLMVELANHYCGSLLAFSRIVRIVRYVVWPMIVMFWKCTYCLAHDCYASYIFLVSFSDVEFYLVLMWLVLLCIMLFLALTV